MNSVLIQSIKADGYRISGSNSFGMLLILFVQDPGFRLLVLFRLSKFKGPLSLCVYLIFRYLSSRRGILIPRQVAIGPGCNLGHAFNIVINQAARIGKNVNFAQNITIGSVGETAPRIGNNVYIGPNSVIFGDIVIGDNTVIGAGAIVNKSFDGNVLVAGNPASVIKTDIKTNIHSLLKNVKE